MKFIFAIEMDTDDIIGAKEQIACALEDIGKAVFVGIEEGADNERN